MRPRRGGPKAGAIGGKMHRNGRNEEKDGEAVATCHRLLQVRRTGWGCDAALCSFLVFLFYPRELRSGIDKKMAASC